MNSAAITIVQYVMTIETKVRREVVGDVLARSEKRKVFNLHFREPVETQLGVMEGTMNSITDELIQSLDNIEIEGELILGPREITYFCSDCGNRPLFKGEEPYCPVCE